MKRFYYYITCLSFCAFAQQPNATAKAYRAYTLNEKNIVRLNKSEKDSIQYLIPIKQLLLDAVTYFSPYVSDLNTLNKVEFKYNIDNYYLIFSNQTQTIVSLLHKTYRPNIEAPFFILGSHHYLLSDTTALYYPTIQNNSSDTLTYKYKYIDTKK